MALQMALDYMRYALGILDQSKECPEIAAHLDLAVSRLSEELKMNAVAEGLQSRGVLRHRQLRVV
jgi:hypothetical protein